MNSMTFDSPISTQASRVRAALRTTGMAVSRPITCRPATTRRGSDFASVVPGVAQAIRVSQSWTRSPRWAAAKS